MRSWREALLLVLMALLVAVVRPAVRESRALYVGQGPVPNNTFSTAACFGDPNAMYVWDVAFQSRTRGGSHDERLSVTVRHDSNGNCAAEGSDGTVQGASVTLEVRDGQGAVVGSASGTTRGNGVYTTGWFSGLADGTYTATVTALSHGTYTWDPALDGVNPAFHTIPH